MIKNRLSKLIKAVKEYNMIEPNDKIAVGLSGGKDSLLTLDLLAEYKKICGYNFDLIAITIDMGFDGSDFSELENFCKVREVPYHIIKSDIYEVVFNIRKEKNPCSLCAKLRRGILCNEAKKLGFSKLALGHHLDDTIETFFLSMLYENRLSTFSPTAYLSQTKITVIRPIIFMGETDVIEMTKDFPIFHNPCPADKHTKRQEIKNLMTYLQTINSTAKQSIINAISSPERYNLWKDKNK